MGRAALARYVVGALGEIKEGGRWALPDKCLSYEERRLPGEKYQKIAKEIP